LKIGFYTVGLVCIIGIAYLAWTWTSMPSADFPSGNPGDGKEVGAYGPLAIVFSQPMQTASVEARLLISPPLHGRFVWQAQTLRFWPDGVLPPGSIYHVTLQSGAASLSGRVILFSKTWSVQVRLAQVLYLAHLREGAEIMLNTPAGKTQLTHTGGKVDGLAVSRDGTQIAYVVKNSRSGEDLWVVGRDGKQAHLLLDCGVDLCAEPTWSPDNNQIAFSRKNNQPASTTILGGRIWFLDIASRQVSPLYTDATITGSGPSWSPDGQRLAFFDENAGGLRVLDLKTHQDQLLPTSDGHVGSWSSDGQQMLLNDVVTNPSTSYEAMFLVGFGNQPVRQLKGPVDETIDANYSVPALSPDGQWIVVGLNFNNGPASSQLWLEKSDGTGAKAITTNQVFTLAAYHWDPTSQEVVFQRLELDTSQARPEVVVWNRAANTMTAIDQDAGLPVWLP
jgi:Tol biopolymer transport system component